MKYRTLYFTNGRLRLLDQTLLPAEARYIECASYQDVCNAISTMQVRGAPAIGIAAAYGLVLAADSLVKPNGQDPKNWDEFLIELGHVANYIRKTRPTAINLKWALNRIVQRAKSLSQQSDFNVQKVTSALLKEADVIYEEDKYSSSMIAEFGVKLIETGFQVLTYCNAGSLATAEGGTALAPMYLAAKMGKKFNVYCCETRPVLQGARLTCWELQQGGMEPILICDNTAAVVMREKRVNLVIVGADRIAANGDVANKIGTYNLAVLANYHKIPFYVAAPASTFDLDLRDGQEIPIEMRTSKEVTMIGTKSIAPEVTVYNPAFDITPAELIKGIITDRGIISPVTNTEIEKWLAF